MGSKTRLGSYCTKRANNGVNLVTSCNMNTRLARPIFIFIILYFRYVFPEFLPAGDWKLRDKVLEKFERRDMMRRREVLDIPEFYVGKLLS